MEAQRKAMTCPRPCSVKKLALESPARLCPCCLPLLDFPSVRGLVTVRCDCPWLELDSLWTEQTQAVPHYLMELTRLGSPPWLFPHIGLCNRRLETAGAAHRDKLPSGPNNLPPAPAGNELALSG